MRKVISGGLIAGGLMLGLGACAEEQAPQPTTELSEADIFGSAHTETLRPGETVFAYPETDENLRDQIKDGIELIDHQHSHGFTDDMAPTLQTDPIRVDAHVALSGRGSDVLNNDLACDTVIINLERFEDQSAVYIGALALSGDTDDNVMVSWPTESSEVYVCFDENAEPSDGVVLFASDEAR